MNLTDAILDVLTSSNSFFQTDADGRRFEAVTETDLMAALRERGWKLPAAGWFNSEVRTLGFNVRQGYQFQGKVRRAYPNGETGRALSNYQTIIFI